MTVNKDVVTGWFSLGLAAALFIGSFGVKDFAATGVGAGFLPRLAAVLLAVLGVILLLQTRRRATPAPGTGDSATAAGKAEGARHFGGTAAALLSACLMAGYVALLSPVGFIITTAIYVFAQILVLAKDAKRNYMLYAIVSVVTSVAAYYLFVRAFQVMLPAGILG